MAEVGSARKLASIVAIDVAGYSRRTEADEEASIRAVAALKALVSRAALAHGGRVFNTAGDGFMLEFPSASSALAAAEEIAAVGDPPVRAGVHLGDVSVTESGDLLGHGVNVAARIQQMAAPGAVLASGDVKRAIRGPLGERLRPQGSVRLDKMSETLPVFALAPAEGGKAKGRRLDLKAPVIAGVAALVLALAGLSLWLGRGAFSGLTPRSTRVAILPFQTLSSGQDTRDFADGLTDELQSVLSTDQMQVVSRTEAEGLRGPDQDAKLRRLGVRLLLDGSVRTEGPNLDVRVHLDDPQGHVTLWTAELSGPAAQPAALQAQAGARTIAVLSCSRRALRPAGGLTDPLVLALYLRACDLAEDNWGDDPQPVYAMLDTMRQVAAKAPQFAPGHSALANSIAVYLTDLPDDQMPELRGEVEREAHRALAIDPQDPDAFVALAGIEPVSNYAGRERFLRRALAANPAWPNANGSMGALLLDAGRVNEALPFFQRAAASNPLSMDVTTYLPLFWTGQRRAADAELSRLTALWPNSAQLWYDRFQILEAEGRWAEASAAIDDTRSRPKTFSDLDVRNLHIDMAAKQFRAPAAIAEDRTSLLAATARAMAKGQQYRLLPLVSELANFGFNDDAYAVVANYSPAKMAGIDSPTLLFGPDNALRRDPRFIRFAARLGLVDYWRSTGKWPDFCAEPGLPYDCKTEAAKLAGGRARG